MLYQAELSVHLCTPGRIRTPINGSVDHRPIHWTTGVLSVSCAKVGLVFRPVKSLQVLQGLQFRQHSLDVLNRRQEPDPAFRIGDPPVSIHNSVYPLFAASMLDIFAASGCDLKSAGTRLGISASRFAKLLWRDPVLWTEANRMRTACGLPALKPMGGR